MSPTVTFDFDHYLAIPRLSGLRLSPDGTRLVVAASLPHVEGKKFAASIWEVDPAGTRAPRRLTRSAPGESNAEFLRDGALLFTSTRPDPDARADEAKEREEVSALWVLPAGGGEARVLFAPGGGVDGVRPARGANVIVLGAPLHPGATTFEEDAARQKARRDAGVQALLFESFPIRFWDHYIGPRERHLFGAELAADLALDPEGGLGEPRDLAPDAHDAMRELDFDVTPDGATIVIGWLRNENLTRPAADLVAIDRQSLERRTIASGDAWHSAVRCSPDGRWAVCLRVETGTPERADRPMVWLVELASGAGPRSRAGARRAVAP